MPMHLVRVVVQIVECAWCRPGSSQPQRLSSRVVVYHPARLIRDESLMQSGEEVDGADVGGDVEVKEKKVLTGGS